MLTCKHGGMKTLIRALVALLLALWVGGVAFFPVVAAVCFSKLPDTHTAGTVVAAVLGSLQMEGIACGVLLLILLSVAGWRRAYAGSVLPPVVVVLVMMGLTAYSQWGLIPRMEADRLALGGVVDAAPASDPRRADFNRLHVRSVSVEEGVLVGGILVIVLLARLGASRMAGTAGVTEPAVQP